MTHGLPLTKWVEVDFMSVSSVLDILKSKAIDYGIPYEIVYAIVGTETGGTFDPNQVGDNGNSFGLFQSNKPTHSDFDSSNKDANYQANYQLPELKQYYDLGVKLGYTGADLAKYVEVNGERPDYKNAETRKYVDSAIPKYYNQASSGGETSVATNSSSNTNDTMFLGVDLTKLDAFMRKWPGADSAKEFFANIFGEALSWLIVFVLYVLIGLMFFGSIYLMFK